MSKPGRAPEGHTFLILSILLRNCPLCRLHFLKTKTSCYPSHVSIKNFISQLTIYKLSMICNYIIFDYNNGSSIISTNSSHPDIFSKKDVLRNIADFKGKYQWRSLFSNQVADLGRQLKKRQWHKCFPANCAKFLKHLFYKTSSVAASVQIISPLGLEWTRKSSSSIPPKITV